MKFYEITIRPISAFATSLKGDTLFGHFCWQAAYDPSLVEGGLETVFAQYSERPFAVFSSVYPKLKRETGRYLLKRPDLPLSWLFPEEKESREQRYENMKERKKLKWMILDQGLGIDLKNMLLLNDKAIVREALSISTEEVQQVIDTDLTGTLIHGFLQPHNTINRFTDTTGTGEFAPYVIESCYYLPETELVLFVLVDEDLTSIDSITTGLDRIGRFGFGKDASTGKGRFEILGSDELPIPDAKDANACYTLAPCVPDHFDRMYFTPFIRYGKHGDRLANAENPFKNPVIMADEGAVFFLENGKTFDKPYIGRAVNNVSKAQPEAVVQGYTPYLPMKLEH